VWVWLIFAEVPSRAAIFGGSIVLAAVVYYLLSEARSGDALEEARQPE